MFDFYQSRCRHHRQVDTQALWNVRIDILGVNTKQYNVSFLNVCQNDERYYGPPCVLQTLSIELSIKSRTKNAHAPNRRHKKMTTYP